MPRTSNHRALFWVALAVLVIVPLFLHPAAARELVAYERNARPGSIIVATSERRLYLVVAKGRAVSYPIGVGRQGRQWAGVSSIEAMFLSPNWAPPAEVLRDRPTLPAVVPGGSPANPMGAAAMTLSGGEYAIHGTNDPNSIGGFVSYGCIRMLNEDVLDLMARVRVGTLVMVIP